MPSDPDATPRPPVHVVAAVLEDLRGRVLLTRRTNDRDFAGLWEFPGGKVEPGETPLAALARELHEELGITIGPATPVIRVPCAVASLSPPLAQRGEAGRGGDLATPRHKRLLLDVHHTTTWTGRPHGREGQATIWVPRDRLHRYAMPPADRPVVSALSLPPLMLVTPEPDPAALDDFVANVLLAVHRLLHPPVANAVNDRPAPPVLAAAVASEPGAAAAPGSDATTAGSMLLPHSARGLLVQLRARQLDSGTRRQLAATLQQALPAAATLLVNGDIETAQKLRTGLHLGEAQLHEARTRPLPRNRLVGASCHSREALQQAEALDCDYAVLGPVRETASHPGAPALGWPAFAALREAVSLPIYAIGGLAPEDLAQARHHGAQGVAAIRAVWPWQETGVRVPFPA